jgi:hypothetical protein
MLYRLPSLYHFINLIIIDLNNYFNFDENLQDNQRINLVRLFSYQLIPRLLFSN